VLVEDRLFATLDATTRRMDLPGGESVYMTDTVGFVRKLPHQLVDAFKSTLDVVVDADLLLHVVDCSDPDPSGSIDAVRYVLREIGADEVPVLYVFNKADLAPVAAVRLVAGEPGSVSVSAENGEGIDGLLEALGRCLRDVTHLVDLVVPFDRGDVLAMVHREGEVLEETADESGWMVRARLDEGSAGRLSEFAVEGDG
jgi:GTP-binding protein HflX